MAAIALALRAARSIAARDSTAEGSTVTTTSRPMLASSACNRRDVVDAASVVASTIRSPSRAAASPASDAHAAAHALAHRTPIALRALRRVRMPPRTISYARAPSQRPALDAEVEDGRPFDRLRRL